jgi:hypothetical protein
MTEASRKLTADKNLTTEVRTADLVVGSLHQITRFKCTTEMANILKKN